MREDPSPERETPLKILHVVTLASATSRYGGPFDVIREQGALVAGDDRTVELVAGHLHGDEAAQTTVGRSSYRPVRRWLPTRDFTALMSLSLLRQLWISTGRADVVHVSFAREAIPVAAVAIALLRHRPVVAQPHGMLTSRTSRAHAALDRVLRPLLRRVDHWIALTPTEERALRSRFGNDLRDVTAIGNPVSLDAAGAARLRGEAPSAERSAVFIARLHPRKRVLDFAGAAAVAERHGWDERYRVFGPDQGDLEGLRSAAELLPHLTYEGKLDSDTIAEFLLRSGVFVLTSDAEPWGNVLATAVTLGVPSVITRSSALAEVLGGAAGVRVVDDGDEDAIASAVHELLAEGHVAPSHHFDRDGVRQALLTVYRSVLATEGRR